MKSRITGNFLYTTFAVLLSFIIVMFSNLLGDEPTENSVRIKCVWLLVIYAFYVITWIKSTHYVYSIFFFFLLYTIFSNAGQLIIVALGIDFISVVDVFALGIKPLNAAIDFQILSISTFCTFGLISWHFHHEKGFTQNDSSTNSSDSILSVSNVLFLLLSIASIIINLLKLESRFDQSYGDAFGTNSLGSYVQIVKFLFYISLFVSIVKYHNKNGIMKRIVFICMIAVGATDILFGSRSVIIPLICGFLFLFGISKRKTTWPQKIGFALLAICGVVVLNSLSALRQLSLSDLSFKTVIEVMFSNNIFKQMLSLVAEMGGSLRTLIYTIRAIDAGVVKQEPTLLYTLVHGILPNQVLDVIGFEQPQNWYLSTWITNRFGGSAGWGYSMTAEAYYNFGGSGFLFFALFGYGYEWSECHIKKMFLQGKTVIAAAWLFVIAYMVFLARSDSRLVCSYIRYALYVTIVAIILRKVRHSNAKNRARKNSK